MRSYKYISITSFAWKDKQIEDRLCEKSKIIFALFPNRGLSGNFVNIGNDFIFALHGIFLEFFPFLTKRTYYSNKSKSVFRNVYTNVLWVFSFFLLISSKVSWDLNMNIVIKTTDGMQGIFYHKYMICVYHISSLPREYFREFK